MDITATLSPPNKYYILGTGIIQEEVNYTDYFLFNNNPNSLLSTCNNKIPSCTIDSCTLVTSPANSS